MIQKILNHFQKNDPTLFQYMQKYTLEVLPSKTNLFESLCDEIISQQLSGKAASTIFDRFKKLFQKNITPKELILLPDEQIRKAGCSWAKIRSLKDLASKIESKELNLESLRDKNPDIVMEKLTRVKGIGPWTAQMFLMFTLGHEDIFSHGDLGLKKAINKIYNLENPTKNEIDNIISKWSPYKTYASRILWKTLDSSL
jgi:DNA-3-methyladenine glycosylase II